jgi:hypothetical protein
MQINLEYVAKAIYVGFLLVMWAVLDKIGINDMKLIGTIWALIGTILGWHGLNNPPGANGAANQALAQIVAMLKPAPAPAVPTVPPSPQ